MPRRPRHRPSAWAVAAAGLLWAWVAWYGELMGEEPEQ